MAQTNKVGGRAHYPRPICEQFQIIAISSCVYVFYYFLERCGGRGQAVLTPLMIRITMRAGTEPISDGIKPKEPIRIRPKPRPNALANLAAPCIS